VADSNNPQFIFDLSSLHGLQFSPDPRVGTKEHRINQLRLMVQRREIIIDPRCKNLISQLKYVRWRQGDRMTFERSEAHGHYFLVDSLIILVNTVVKGRNTIPDNYDVQRQTHVYRPKPVVNELQKLVPKSFQKIRRPF
jgi:hypothetical protein